MHMQIDTGIGIHRDGHQHVHQWLIKHIYMYVYVYSGDISQTTKILDMQMIKTCHEPWHRCCHRKTSQTRPTYENTRNDKYNEPPPPFPVYYPQTPRHPPHHSTSHWAQTYKYNTDPDTHHHHCWHYHWCYQF